MKLDLDLDLERRALVERVAELARERLAPRAAHYDRTASFPAEDFADLFAAGLLAAVVPREHGGLGVGPFRGDAFTLWMMTKELAKADLSLARCWEGHANSLVLIDALGSEEQRTRWFAGVVERGEVGYPGRALVLDRGQQPRLGVSQRHADPLRGQSIDPGHYGQQVGSECRGHDPHDYIGLLCIST